MKKRTIAWLMALCVAVGLFSVTALAADEEMEPAAVSEETLAAPAEEADLPSDEAALPEEGEGAPEGDGQAAEEDITLLEEQVPAPVPEAFPTLPAGATLPAGVTLPTQAGEPTKIDLAKVTVTGSAKIFISRDGLKMGGSGAALCETMLNPSGYEFTGENGRVGVKVDENIDVTIILNGVRMVGSNVIYFDVSLARTTMILKGENHIEANGIGTSGCILKDGLDDPTYYPDKSVADAIDYKTWLIMKEDPNDPGGSLYCKGSFHSTILGSSWTNGHASQKTAGFCNLEIKSGTYELIAERHDPAIGANCWWSGGNYWSYTQNIKITGGKVTAKGGSYCSAIGSGWGSPVYDLEISGTADVTAYGGANSPAIGSGGHDSGSGTPNEDIKNFKIDLTDGARLQLYGDMASNMPAIGNGTGPKSASHLLENVKVVNNSENDQTTIVYGESPTNYHYDKELSGLTGTYDIGNYLVTQKEAGKLVYYVGIYNGEKRDNWFISEDDGKYRSAANDAIRPTGGAPFSEAEINGLTKPIYEIAKEQITHQAGDFTINAEQLQEINTAKVRGQTGSFPLTYTATGMIDDVETTITATCTVYLLENNTNSEHTFLEMGCNNARLDTGAAFDVAGLRTETTVAGVKTSGEAVDSSQITVTADSLAALNAAAEAGELGKFTITFSYTDPETDEEITVDSTITLTKPVTYKYEALQTGLSKTYESSLATILAATPSITVPTDTKAYAAGEAINIAANPIPASLTDDTNPTHGKWIFAGYYSGNTKLGSSLVMSDEVSEIVGRWVFTGDKLAVTYQGNHGITTQTTGDLDPDTATPTYTGSIPTVSGFVFGGWSPAVAEKVAYDQVTGATDKGEGEIVYTAIWRTAGTVAPPHVIGTTAYTVTVDGVEGQEYSIDGGKTWTEPIAAGEPHGGKVIFTGLTPNSPYTVLTRLPAKDGNDPSETKEAPAHTVKYDAPQIADMFKEPSDSTGGDTSNPPYDQATNKTVDVVVDDDGNYKIVLKEDIRHTVTLPTDLGDVDLDLNDHIIKGDNGTKDSPDGKPGLKLERPADDPGPDTDLTVKDDSEEKKGEIIGGDGYSPDPKDPDDETPPGKGGSGVSGPEVPPDEPDDPDDPDNPDDPDPTPDEPEKPTPTVTAGPGATIKGGDGGDGKPPKAPEPPENPDDPPAEPPKAPGGDGGPGIDGDVDVVIDGGEVGGGEGGEPGTPEDEPGKPGKPTDTPKPPKVPPEDKPTGGGSGDSTKYTLTFEVNGGSAVAPVTRSAGTTVNLSGYTSRRESYTFEGWYLDPECTLEAASVKLNKDMTVYAKWSPVLPTDLNGLNKEDHFAYVVGCPDGLVRPESGISRAETVTILYRLLTKERRDAFFTAQNDFPDVERSYWYNKAVSSMVKGGYVLGYPDGTFGGDNNITRAEFATLLTRFLGVDDTATASFSDVSRSHWAYRYIATAEKNGYMVGYNGEFRPEDKISRAEAMAMMNRLLNRGVNKSSQIGEPIQWPDNPQGEWYYYEVIEATNDHEHSGTRPSEDWPSLKIDYYYDIKHYEMP